MTPAGFGRGAGIVGFAFWLTLAAPGAACAAQPLERIRQADTGGLLAVEAEAGGVRGRWLLDTGSSEHLVGTALAARLGLEPGAGVELRTTLGTQRGRRVVLPRLALDGWTGDAVPAVQVDLQALVGALGVDIDGVLGAPLLAARRVRLDLAQQMLALAPDDAEAPCPPARRVALETQRGVPLLALDSAAGRGERHLLDTGNPGALVRLAGRDGGDAARALTLDLPAGPMRLWLLPEARAGAALRRTQVPLAQLPDTSLGAALPARVVGSAGVAFLDGAVLDIDLPGRALCVAQPPATEALPGGFGLLLAQGPAGVRIAGVLPGSPAAQAGLQATDELVALDGRAAPRSLPQAWNALAARGSVVLDVRRAGATRRASLERARFLPDY